LVPFFRASESPIAIACFLLLTFRPDLPLLSVPAFRFFMARPTFFAAPLEYFRFLAFLAIAPILLADFAQGITMELAVRPKVHFIDAVMATSPRITASKKIRRRESAGAVWQDPFG
jgi:hypothetical protein